MDISQLPLSFKKIAVLYLCPKKERPSKEKHKIHNMRCSFFFLYIAHLCRGGAIFIVLTNFTITFEWSYQSRELSFFNNEKCL